MEIKFLKDFSNNSPKIMIATEELAIDTSAAGHQRAPRTARDVCYWVVTIPGAPYTIPSVLEPTDMLDGAAIHGYPKLTNFDPKSNLFMYNFIIKNIHQKNTKLYSFVFLW